MAPVGLGRLGLPPVGRLLGALAVEPLLRWCAAWVAVVDVPCGLDGVGQGDAFVAAGEGRSGVVYRPMGDVVRGGSECGECGADECCDLVVAVASGLGGLLRLVALLR